MVLFAAFRTDSSHRDVHLLNEGSIREIPRLRGIRTLAKVDIENRIALIAEKMGVWVQIGTKPGSFAVDINLGDNSCLGQRLENIVNRGQ